MRDRYEEIASIQETDTFFNIEQWVQTGYKLHHCKKEEDGGIVNRRIIESKEKEYAFVKTSTFDIAEDKKGQLKRKVYDNLYRAYNELDIKKILAINGGQYEMIDQLTMITSFK